MKYELKTYLENEPRARERRNKDRAIVNLLLKHYPSLASVKKEILVEFVKDHNTLDRSWRQLLQEYPRLRGSDYDQKEVLVQQKRIELGYEPQIGTLSFLR